MSLSVGEEVPFNFEVVLPLSVVYRVTTSGIMESMTVMVEDEDQDVSQNCSLLHLHKEMGVNFCR